MDIGNKTIKMIKNSSLFDEKFKNIDKIQGYLVPGQEKVLYRLASSLKPSSTIVEIGCYLGKSTACLAYGAPRNSKIYTIDTFEGNKKDFIEGVQFRGGNFYKKFKKNVKRLGLFAKIRPLKGFSYEIGKKWNKPVDLLFIDGSHVYEDVKLDFELFFPWLKPRGLVVFHDVSPDFPGVYRVWNEIVKKKLSAYANKTTLFVGIKAQKYSSRAKDKHKLLSFVGKIKPKVFVVLPVHNRLSYTKKCLNSFAKQKYKNFELVLVDDGSRDNTSTFFKKKYPQWKLIRGDGNWWWTKSMYEGVNESLKTAKPDDFVLSMNNDCYFNSNYLRNIVKASLESNRAIIGSLILDADKPTRVVDAGVKIVWEQGLIYGVAEKISDKLRFYQDRENIKDIDTLPGKGTLIPIEVFKRVGNFNYKRLPHYIGDYEFFCRAKEKGFNLVVNSKARLYNFAKNTGVSHYPGAKLNYREVYQSLFGRKSKQNIIDVVNFTLLTAPKKHIPKNLLILINKLAASIPIFYKIRLLLHNIPIYFRQNRLTRKIFLLIHNLHILVTQSWRKITKSAL